MAHIKLPDNAPGIVGPMLAYPATERHLNGLAQALLRGPSSLTSGERELIASFVSMRNGCRFCAQSHAAVARQLLGSERGLVDDVLCRSDPQVSERMKALLEIAMLTAIDGRRVTAQHVDAARAAGADDTAIHDTVLIAAAFCMYNRYVDGLATWTPDDSSMYDEIGEKLAQLGYEGSIQQYVQS
jgi:uncharacterized peroxidase-related enzyme